MDGLLAHLQHQFSLKSPLYLRVKAVPKSPKNEIVEVMADETYKIRVAAPAEGGKANAELCRFLKKSLGISTIEIVSGKTDRIKLLKLAK